MRGKGGRGRMREVVPWSETHGDGSWRGEDGNQALKIV